MHNNQTRVGIFCNNPRANGKILLGFCRWNQVDANLGVGLQKYIIAAALYSCFVDTSSDQPKEFFGFNM